MSSNWGKTVFAFCVFVKNENAIIQEILLFRRPVAILVFISFIISCLPSPGNTNEDIDGLFGVIICEACLGGCMTSWFITYKHLFPCKHLFVLLFALSKDVELLASMQIFHAGMHALR